MTVAGQSTWVLTRSTALPTYHPDFPVLKCRATTQPRALRSVFEMGSIIYREQKGVIDPLQLKLLEFNNISCRIRLRIQPVIKRASRCGGMLRGWINQKYM
jgi:hypothetical protein